MTKLIDADALYTNLGFAKECEDCDHQYNSVFCESSTWQVVCDAIYEAPTVDAIPVELVAEMFDNVEPCNFGLFGIPVDDFMCFECGDWCESNCDKVPAVECWKKFFEAWEERKDEWIR